MKIDHSQFTAAAAYTSAHEVEDRIRRFVPMVRKAAWQIHSGAGDAVEIDDLIQAGFLALTECAQRHAGPTEDGFAAYAKMRVRGAMIDWVRKTVPGSRGSAARRRLLEEEHSQLQSEASDRRPRKEPQPIHLMSLDSTYDDASPCFADDRPDPFALLSEAQDTDRLAAIIAGLPERLQLILQLYFLEELNLAEIAAVLDVSVPRVHQLKAQAIALVRTRLGEA